MDLKTCVERYQSAPIALKRRKSEILAEMATLYVEGSEKQTDRYYQLGKEHNDVCNKIWGLALGTGGLSKDKAPSHSLLNMYAQGRQEAFADVIKVNAAKIAALKEEQDKISARIDKDMQMHEQVSAMIDVFEKVSKGAERAIAETDELRKGLVV
ncbi:MAG: hypothetical protein WC375_09220 [Methanomassiliicoccales archaeon]|jgi:hypothetical protein